MTRYADQWVMSDFRGSVSTDRKKFINLYATAILISYISWKILSFLKLFVVHLLLKQEVQKFVIRIQHNIHILQILFIYWAIGG